MKTETKTYKNALEDKISEKKRKQRLRLMGLWLIINLVVWFFIPYTERNLTTILDTLAFLTALLAILLPWSRWIKVDNDEVEQYLKKNLAKREQDIEDHKQSIIELEQEIMELNDEEEDSDEIIADILDSKQEIIEFKKEILEFIQECIAINETLETTDVIEDLKKEYSLLDQETDLLIEQHVELINRFQSQH